MTVSVFKTLLITALVMTITSGDVVLTNSGGVNPGAEWNITLSAPTTSGHAVTMSHSLTTTDSTFGSGVEHPMACFPNDKGNQLEDGEIVIGWMFLFYSSGSSSDETTLTYELYDASVTKNGENYDYTLVSSNLFTGAPLTSANVTGSSYDGTTVTGSIELSDSDAAAINMYPNITSAICFFAKNTSHDTAQNDWGYNNQASINLDPQATMILFEASAVEEETEEETDELDIGGKTLSGSDSFPQMAPVLILSGIGYLLD